MDIVLEQLAEKCRNGGSEQKEIIEQNTVLKKAIRSLYPKYQVLNRGKCMIYWIERIAKFTEGTAG